MDFSLTRDNNQDYLVFETEFSNVVSSINARLSLHDLPIVKTTKYGIYFIKKKKVFQNKLFYKFLLQLQKDFNFIFTNSTNAQWVTLFLEDLKKYQKILNTQRQIYAQIMQKTTRSVSLQTTFFSSTFVPKSFQKKYACLSLKNKRFANFSSPGSGKTVVSYMSAFSLFADQQIELLIVIGPKSAQYAWFQEWDLIGLPAVFVADENFNFANKPVQYIDSFIYDNCWPKTQLTLIFINFHKLQKSSFIKQLLKMTNNYKKLLVIDEAHYLKNPNSDLHTNICQLSSQAEYVQLLTGTPLPRFSEEAFYIFNCLFPDIVEDTMFNKQAFKNAHLKTSLGGWKNSTARENLQTKMKLFFMRKTKKDLINSGFLKPLQEIKKNIAIDPIEKFLIESCQDQQLVISSNELFNSNNISLLIRRMQASSYPPLLLEGWKEVVDDLINDVTDDVVQAEFSVYFQKKQDSEQKFNQILNQMLQEPKIQEILTAYQTNKLIPSRWIAAQEICQTKNKELILIWDVFKQSMLAFQKYLNKIFPHRKIFLINGEVPSGQRLAIISAFKKSFNGILIASPATIAESVSFHREVNIAIYLYKNYIGAHFMQSKERIHRLVGEKEIQAQKTLYFIEAQSPSIDYDISLNLETKEKEQEKFLD